MGHFVGDDVMRRVVAAMRDASLEIDQVARLGGAEFAVLLPGADLAGAERWRARFHERLEIANASADDGARVSAAPAAPRARMSETQLSDLLADRRRRRGVARRSRTQSSRCAGEPGRARRAAARADGAQDDRREASCDRQHRRADRRADLGPAAAIVGLLVAMR